MIKQLTAIFLFSTFATISIADWEAQVTPDELDNFIEWEKAVEILEGCKIGHFIQYHSLQVSLVMKNGAIYNTIEPDIDVAEIHAFRGYEKCGVTSILYVSE